MVSFAFHLPGSGNSACHIGSVTENFFAPDKTGEKQVDARADTAGPYLGSRFSWRISFPLLRGLRVKAS